MTDHYPNHGRVVLRPGDGVGGEDMLGVTIYDGEISMSVAEWRMIAWEILLVTGVRLGSIPVSQITEIQQPSEAQQRVDGGALLTADDLRAMRARCDAATEGPWLYRPHEFDDWGMVRISHPSEPWVVATARAGGPADLGEHRAAKTDPYRHNGEFIAHARADMPRLLDAVEALTGEVARLKRDRVRGYVVESGVVNYAVIREALSKLSGIPAMSDVTMDHIKRIGQKLTEARAEIDRLKAEHTAMRSALAAVIEAADGECPENATVSFLCSAHIDVTGLRQKRDRLLDVNDELRKQVVADFGQVQDVDPVADAGADLRALREGMRLRPPLRNDG